MRNGTSRGLSWAVFLAACCLTVASCDLLEDDESSATGILPGESGGVTITLTWDNAADLDLHVTDPDGETIYFAHPSSESGGSLDVDDTDGEGPETISWAVEDAPEGSYEVQVDHFAGPSPAGYTVTVQQATSHDEYTGSVSLGQMVSVVTFEYGASLPEPASRAAIPVERPKELPTRKR